MDNSPFSLSGKTLLVTGASSGIGKFTAVECSKMGARLFITGRNEERLQSTFEQLEGKGHLMKTADLTVDEELTELVDAVPDLDGIFSNAGMLEKKPVQFIKEEKLDAIMGINFKSAVLLLSKLVKKKRLKNPSSVVFLSSIAGVHSVSLGNSIYSASKGALHAFMKNAALELASKGIRCNSINPGMVYTELLENAKLSKDQLNDAIKRYPLKRLGTPKDIAPAVIYLLSDASAWVTGANIVIDGGYTLH